VGAGAGAVEATVRLESPFAAMATEGSSFSIVRPSLGLDGISGLETIVTGPFIAFKPGPASAVRPTRFAGSSAGHARTSSRDGFLVTLRADRLPSMGEGTPVFYRGLPAGRVLSAQADAQGRPELTAFIDNHYRDKVRANARFWRVPATAVDLGTGFLEVKLQGLSALWQGGVAFDVFGEDGPLAEPDTAFTLHDNEQLAAAVSPPVRITFDNGRGLLAGRTQLRYLGLPVGVVESVKVLEGKVEVTARFRPGFDFLRRRGSEFAIMRPTISLQNVTGLETLLSGIYIACAPGRGAGYADSFSAMEKADLATLGEPGFIFRLVSGATRVNAGAPITYNETQVGTVLDKTLSPDGKQVILTAEVRPDYRNLVRTDSKFWDASALNAKLGIFRVEIKTPAIVSSGRVAFTTPDSAAEPAPQGTTFTLLPKPPRS
jgi:paraquat-inducible protein B